MSAIEYSHDQCMICVSYRVTLFSVSELKGHIFFVHLFKLVTMAVTIVTVFSKTFSAHDDIIYVTESHKQTTD